MTNQKSLDKKKPSELFEGVGSSLHQAFVGAVERDKNKTKELEWDRFVKENHTNFSKDANGIKYEFYEDDLLEFITQQRTELEQQKVKVVWNDVCEQIKKEARTELLEEIKNMPIEIVGNSQATVNQIINLLNKKDE